MVANKRPTKAKARFTDDDLAKLKKSKHEDCEWIVPWDKFKALIARLEAGETIIEESGVADEECRLDHNGNCQNHFVSDPCPVPVWRESAGKKLR